MSDSYIAELLSGRATIEQFSDYVADWHAADFREGEAPEVFEYLGLTWEEYAFVVMDPARLRFVAAARHHGLPLDDFKQTKDQLALAARAGDSQELAGLVAHLVDQGVLA